MQFVIQSLLIALLVCFVLFAWRWIAMRGRLFSIPVAFCEFVLEQKGFCLLVYAFVVSAVVTLQTLSI